MADEDAIEAACLSSPDFRGARVGYLADRHPSGGARLFEIRFDEARGILEFKVYNAGRSKVRGFLRSLASAQAHRLFDVPRESFCALVRRASHAQPVDRPLPSGFVEWRSRLFGEDVEGHATPGGLAREALRENLAGVSEASALDAVAEAIIAGEVGPWPPPSAWVADRMDRGRDAVKGLEGDALESAIETWSGSVAGELDAEADPELLARNLEELAWIRLQMKGQGKTENEAVELLAVGALVDSERADGNGSTRGRLARARVDALFAPFVGELRAAASVQDDASAEDANA